MRLRWPCGCKQVADDPGLRERMGAAALTRVRSVDGWDAYGSAWDAMLQELSGRGERRVEPFHRCGSVIKSDGGQPWNRRTKAAAVPQDAVEEGKLIRRMQLMMNLVMQTIAQDSSLTIDEASQMIADSKKAALAMFPDKELAYEIIWRPRFQRLMRERFRIM